MIHVKDLTAITGYVRGGCSPSWHEKAFPTVIDASARQYSEIYVSGGRIGTSIRLDPQDLARVVRATFAIFLPDHKRKVCQVYFPDTLFLLIFARLPDNIQHTLQLGSLCRSLSIVNMLPVFFEFSKQMFSRYPVLQS